IQAKMGAAEDIKATTGQYNASLGQQGNERSGRAILARQQEGDTGTYHFVDNLGRAIRHVARQLVDMIPQIYDTQRIARIIGVDGEVGMAKINPMQPEPVKEIRDQMGNVIEKIYNPSVGTYDVIITTGPSYLTKRQEAVEAMANILQTSPQLWQVAGDLFIKNMDWPGAQEMAARFKKIIDPKVLAEDDKSPELQSAEQMIEALTQQLNQTMGMVENIQNSMDAQELRIKAYEAETKRIAATSAGMSTEQIQDIVMGTIAAAVETGDISGSRPMMPQMDEERGAMGMEEEQMPVGAEQMGPTE
ncbi:MAG TPA: portal protein, partial [Burkholderiaceae bacterium]|nr:portal protein [Burkholderiaceae bacterium]